MELASKSVGHTPASSPGLFHPATPSSGSATSTDGGVFSSPFLHWTQKQQPKETHTADKDIDPISGRKLLNQYEIIDELGRGVHGKVKLGRNLDKGTEVAIKIVARYSKRRRLGKLGNPEDKVKKEVAILKKAIHPNVVALLEVIDDPAIMKVYIVLEFVELGEIVWRTKGAREVVWIERRRIERESRGVFDPAMEQEDQRIFREIETKRAADRLQLQQQQAQATAFWSLEHGGESDYEGNVKRRSRRTPVREATVREEVASPTLLSNPSSGIPSGSLWTPRAPLRRPLHQSNSALSELKPTIAPRSHSSLPALESSHVGTSEQHPPIDSVSSPQTPTDLFSFRTEDPKYDAYAEDFSYVPCLTLDQARQAFRDTILGLEYLHFQGIIHRDIKPANLLWTGEHRVKISDFGVSYLGRPIRDDDLMEDLAEADAQPLDEAVELAKTVGTPAFYAPELCYTDLSAPRPPVTGQIDLWALGVTLYCLVFARLPFQAEDEYQLFKSISEDEVFIPRKRLKAVDPCLSSKSSSYPRLAPVPGEDLRLEHGLVYEDIDDDLYDLLKRILEKSPTKRITLKEVKRHPFTLHGIADPIRWIDDTDPSRQNEGRKIEVSNEDVEKAVVPIGFLERVRSGMRKVTQAIGFGKAREGRRRVRGNGSTAESGSDSLSPTPTLKEGRRQSLRGDEILYTPARTTREGEHPLSQSVTVSPEVSDRNPFFHDVTSHPAGWPPSSATSSGLDDGSAGFLQLTPLERTPSNSAASTRTVVAYEPGDPDSTVTPLISPGLPGRPTALEGLGSSNLQGIFGGAGGLPIRKMPSRSMTEFDFITRHGPRAPSMDRVALGVEDPRAEPSLAISNTVASGYVDAPPTYPEGPISGTPELVSPAVSETSPGLASPQLLKSVLAGSTEASVPDGNTGRPTTAPAARRRASMVRSETGSASGPSYESTSESFARAQDQLHRRRQMETDQAHERLAQATDSRAEMPVQRNCPPSPDDEDFFRKRQEDGARRAGEVHHSRSSDATHSHTTSPANNHNHSMISSSSEDQITSGMSQSTSYPSVPSVISAGSSVSTDDLAFHLNKKDPMPPALRTEDTITPPTQVNSQDSITLTSDDDAGYVGDHGDDDGDDDEEEDSEEDDFLVMTRRRSRSDRVSGQVKPTPRIVRHATGSTVRSTRSGSTGTLKKTSSREEDDTTTASESKLSGQKQGKSGTVPESKTPAKHEERPTTAPEVEGLGPSKEEAATAPDSDTTSPAEEKPVVSSEPVSADLEGSKPTIASKQHLSSRDEESSAIGSASALQEIIEGPRPAESKPSILKTEPAQTLESTSTPSETEPSGTGSTTLPPSTSTSTQSPPTSSNT